MGDSAARRAVLDERLDAYGRSARPTVDADRLRPGRDNPPSELRFFKPVLGIRGSRSEMVQRTGELVALGIHAFYGYLADSDPQAL